MWRQLKSENIPDNVQFLNFKGLLQFIQSFLLHSILT